MTDEGSLYPRPCPRGVLSCGAEPLSGILRMKTGRGKTRPYVKTRAARGKRRAHNAHPYAKTEGDPVGGGFQPPEKPSPHRGEGVTAYAVTDEGSFYPRPCPRGVLSCGAEPLSGILRMKTGGGKTRPYVKTRAARGKRRAHNAHPYAKTEGDPVGGGFQPPEKPSPHRGEGVTAYAVTDEGSFYPRPCPRGVLSCGAEPLSGILRMKTGGGKTRPYVKTRAARGKRRAHNAHPYAKTEGDPVGGGFQPPEKPSPHRGTVSRHMP